MNADPAIRSMRSEDLEEWRRLRRKLWPECPEERHRREMEETVSLPDIRAVFVLARGGDKLGGFVEVQIRKSTNGAESDLVAYVEGWYVEEDLRRRGWGGRLMGAAEAWAWGRGLTEIASDTEVGNAAGIAAHRHWGFRESYRLVHFLKEIASPKRKA